MRSLTFIVCVTVTNALFAQAPNPVVQPATGSYSTKPIPGNTIAVTDAILYKSGTHIPGLPVTGSYNQKISNNKMYCLAEAYTVSTITGTTPALHTVFYTPSGIATDAAGNTYVAGGASHTIKKITAAGVATNFAGNGNAGCTNGTTKATFYYPNGLATDAAGNVYVADKGNHRIRKISPAGVVSTLAGSGARGYKDGPGALAAFDKPVAVTTDAAGNVYVADQCNHAIRKITPRGVVSTLAGCGKQGSADGIANTACFYNPCGVAADSAGNIYVTDNGNNRIRKITAGGVVSTLAGSDRIGSADGDGLLATFFSPKGIATDAAGNIYVADEVNHKIRKILQSGMVSTIAGTGEAGNADGPGHTATFYNPCSITVNTTGCIYVVDYSNHNIRMIKVREMNEVKSN